MKHIDLEPRHWHPFSFIDLNTRLFDYEGILLRGIRAGFESHTRELFDKGVVNRITMRGLFVPTEISEYSCEEYPLILKHERISPVTYPPEWAPEALRAAGLAVLDLQEFLLVDGYMVDDVFPWNFVFRRTRPIFIDFGSILPITRLRHEQVLRDFNRYYLWPLQLGEKGLWRYVVHLFSDKSKGVTYEDAVLLGVVNSHEPSIIIQQAKKRLRSLLARTLPEKLKRYLQRRQNARKPISPDLRAQIDKLRTALLAVRLPTCCATTCNHAFPRHADDLNDMGEWNRKQLSVLQVLQTTAPKSLFDMCCNAGWYSALAESLGTQVIAADVVPEMVSHVYKHARAGDRNIYPIVMDFRFPTPAGGVANNWFKPATERLRSEMVLCLDATHHLVWRGILSFEQIVAGLESFTTKWLLVEFIPPEDDIAGGYWQLRPYPWYTEGGFVQALKTRFVIREVFPSFPPHRKLFLCEGKNIAAE